MNTLNTEIPFKLKHLLLAILILLLTHVGVYLLGYHIGNKNIKTETETKIEYVTGSPINGSVNNLEPISVIIPSSSYLYTYQDTIKGDTEWVIQPVDSAKILEDYLITRNYELELFNVDTLGNCTIKTSVNRNRLTNLDYTFTPVQKVITNNIYNKNKLDLFGGVGVATNGIYEAKVGAFVNHFGGSVGFVNNFDNNKKGIKMDLLIKF